MTPTLSVSDEVDPQDLDKQIAALEDMQRSIERDTIALTLKCHTGSVAMSMLDMPRKSRTLNLSKIVDSTNI